jgi:hypothetical protein
MENFVRPVSLWIKLIQSRVCYCYFIVDAGCSSSAVTQQPVTSSVQYQN